MRKPIGLSSLAEALAGFTQPVSKARTRNGDAHRPAQFSSVSTVALSGRDRLALRRPTSLQPARHLKRHKNTHVLLAEVVGIDVDKRSVLLDNGSLTYDTLIVATGSRHHYFGNHHWEPFAPGLKTVEDPLKFGGAFFPPLKRPNEKPIPNN